MRSLKVEQVFSRREDIKGKYKKLCLIHHPDKGGNAEDFANLQKIYELAKSYKDDDWEFDGVVDVGGNKINYQKRFDFELGKCFIAKNKVFYVISDGNQDLLDNFCKKTLGLKFLSDRMMNDFIDLVPNSRNLVSFNKNVIEVKKQGDVIRLADAISCVDCLHPRTIAWIVSRLLNLCVFLRANNLSHNGISSETVWVNFADHSVHLYGGWFYATEPGKKLIALPKHTVDFGQYSLMVKKVGNTTTDIQMVKQIAKELCGNPNAKHLKDFGGDLKMPDNALQYFVTPATADSLEEYGYWYNDVLTKAFGEKKFHNFILTGEDVYNRKTIAV